MIVCAVQCYMSDLDFLCYNDIMGAYHSTGVFEDYAPTDSGQRPKNFEYYNGFRFCMIPVGLYPHRVVLGWIHLNASNASE